MGPAYKSLILAIACVATILLLLLASGPPDAPRPAAATSDPPATSATQSVPPPAASPTPGAVVPTRTGKFHFDVLGHSADEFRALLERAHMIYEQTPANDRQSLEVVLVLHGPDIDFFAAKNYAAYQDIVDLAAKLDAFNVFDFRMCAASAASRGLASGDVPAFIEFVPYGPNEIRRLEDAGFVQL